MNWAIADIELRDGTPTLALAPDEDGVALLLRLDGRPIHFSLHGGLPRGARLDAEEVWALAGRDAGPALLAAAIRDELAPPPAPARLDLTVAVCTRARTELLARCLDSVLALRAPDRPFAVLVVDNNPPDDATRELVAGLDGVDYAREPLAGLDFARNRALAEATTDLVAFLDDDVEVDRGWLDGLAETIAENPDAGMVTGLVLPAELETPAQRTFERRGGFRRGCYKLRYHGSRHPENPLYPVGAGLFGAGCNMVLRREHALSLGGFDEALDTGPPLPGGGDLDMFHRVVRSGAPLVYEPRLLVYHKHRREMAALRRQYWSWGEGLMAYVAKTYEADPRQRAKLRGLVAWWLPWASRAVAASALRRAPGRLELPLAELAGGVEGLAGGYARSRRRVAEIRGRR